LVCCVPPVDDTSQTSWESQANNLENQVFHEENSLSGTSLLSLTYGKKPLKGFRLHDLPTPVGGVLKPAIIRIHLHKIKCIEESPSRLLDCS
jgi:hypothetical protein